MSVGDRLLPVLGCVSSTLKVKFSVVLEDSSLLHVLLISGLLLRGFFRADLVVLGGTESSGNIRLSFLNITEFELDYDRKNGGENSDMDVASFYLGSLLNWLTFFFARAP